MDSIGDLTNAIKEMDTDTMRDTLAYLLKLYVIDRGLSFEGIRAVQTTSRGTEKPQPSFAELIRELKTRYSIKELDAFSLDGDQVFISVRGENYPVNGENSGGQTLHTPDNKQADISGDRKECGDSTSRHGRFEKLEMD
jgi:hypothetical protein